MLTQEQLDNVELTKETTAILLPDNVTVAYLCVAKAKDISTNITEVGTGVSRVQLLAEKAAKYEALAHLAGFTDSFVDAV